MPAFLLLSSGGYVDIGLAFYSFLSLYAILLWRMNPRRGLLILSGALAGFALGIKYTGAISCGDVEPDGFLDGQATLAISKGAESAGVRPARTPRVQSLAHQKLLYVGNPIFPFGYDWESSR